MDYKTGTMAPEHPLRGRPCCHLVECQVCGAVRECGRPSVFKAFNTGKLEGFTYCEPHIDPDEPQKELCPEGMGCGI